MYEKPFALEIVTPSRVVFQGEVSSVVVPGALGSFQVLANHAPLLSTLGVGIMKVKDPQGRDSVYSTSGGFMEVRNNRAVVIADSIERPDEIDVNRAKAAMERARQRLSAHAADIDIERARAALQRALNRLHLARRS